MRKYRKLYIIIVVAYAALLVVSRIYSVSSFLVDISKRVTKRVTRKPQQNIFNFLGNIIMDLLYKRNKKT